MRDRRLEWIDIAKGIGIIIVILGHCVPYGGFAFNFIFSFHMPLFFILSGYCYKQRDVNTTIHNKIKTLLIPFIKFAFLGLVVTLIIPTWRSELNLKTLARDIYLASPDGCNNSSIWFLSCLFLVTMIVNVALSLTAKLKNRKVIRTVLVMLSAIIGYLISIDQVMMKMLPGDRMPFALDTAFMAILFFVSGYVLKNNKVMEQKNWVKYSVLSGAFLVITLLITVVNGKVNIHALTYKNPVLYLIGAFSGSGCIICLARILELFANKKIRNMFSYYGRNSLIILGTQSLLIRLFILTENMLLGTEYQLYRLPIIDGLICFTLVTFVVSPFLCTLSSKTKKV